MTLESVAAYMIERGAVRPHPNLLAVLAFYAERGLLLCMHSGDRVLGVMLVRRIDGERKPLRHEETGKVLHLDEVVMDTPRLLPFFAEELRSRFPDPPVTVIGRRKGKPHIFPYSRILRHYANVHP